MARDYKKEYQNYHGKPEQIKNRGKRNKARAQAEKANGKATIPTNVDVDHIRPLAKGGSNQPANTRLRSRKANRSFPRTKSARMK